VWWPSIQAPQASLAATRSGRKWGLESELHYAGSFTLFSNMTSSSNTLVLRTNKFAVYETCENVCSQKDSHSSSLLLVICKVNCSYSRGVLERAIVRRNPSVKLLYCDEDTLPAQLVIQSKSKDSRISILQFGDFENIDWEPVMNGSQRASSYLVRKGTIMCFFRVFCKRTKISFVGLSRKAQLALQIKRYLSKHPQSILKQAVPYTLIIETWNAFEDMRIDFGGGFSATFDTNNLSLSLREKLELTLEDVKDAMNDGSRSHWNWILKPSVTNKGADSECTIAQCILE
jgi:hypothetical protein